MTRAPGLIVATFLIVGCIDENPTTSPPLLPKNTGGMSATASRESISQIPAPPKVIPRNDSGDLVMSALEVKQLLTAEQFPTETIQMTARVRGMTCSKDGTTSELMFGYGRGPLERMACTISELEPWARVVPGQVVTVRGNAVENIKFVWRLPEIEFNPSPVIPAVDFAEEFRVDGFDAHDKYTGRWFYLTGKVMQSGNQHQYLSYVLIDGGPGKPVKFELKLECASVVSFTTGQTANALCHYNGSRAEWDPEIESLSVDAFPITGTFPVPGITYAENLSPLGTARPRFTISR